MVPLLACGPWCGIGGPFGMLFVFLVFILLPAWWIWLPLGVAISIAVFARRQEHPIVARLWFVGLPVMIPTFLFSVKVALALLLVLVMVLVGRWIRDCGPTALQLFRVWARWRPRRAPVFPEVQVTRDGDGVELRWTWRRRAHLLATPDEICVHHRGSTQRIDIDGLAGISVVREGRCYRLQAHLQRGADVSLGPTLGHFPTARRLRNRLRAVLDLAAAPAIVRAPTASRAELSLPQGGEEWGEAEEGDGGGEVAERGQGPPRRD